MNPEIENLINMALADGEVTEKERAIILRKAESLGLDQDEIAMILDGKIALMKKEQNVVQETPKSEKEGEVKKCPSCGAVVQSFSTKCSDCSHEFRNINSSNSVKHFFKVLNELENERPEDETNPLKAIGKTYAKMFTGQGILGGGKHDSKKSELIRNYPIPNTKEDIIEFLSIAVPRAKKIGGFWDSKLPEYMNHNNFVPVWKSKCEQIIMKARFSMKEDKKNLEDIEYYAKQLGIK